MLNRLDLVLRKQEETGSFIGLVFHWKTCLYEHNYFHNVILNKPNLAYGLPQQPVNKRNPGGREPKLHPIFHCQRLHQFTFKMILSLKRKFRSKSRLNSASSSAAGSVSDLEDRVVMLCEDIPPESSVDSLRGSQTLGVYPRHGSQSRGVYPSHGTQSRGVYSSHETQSRGVYPSHETQSRGVYSSHETQSRGVYPSHETQSREQEYVELPGMDRLFSKQAGRVERELPRGQHCVQRVMQVYGGACVDMLGVGVGTSKFVQKMIR